MRNRILAAVLMLSTMAGVALATETPTPTVTNTPTHTPTPTHARQGLGVLLRAGETCGSAPCAPTTWARGLPGTKTVGVHISGTATVKIVCELGERAGWQSATAYVGSSLTATGATTFTDACDHIGLEITSCSSCVVTARLNYWAPAQ